MTIDEDLRVLYLHLAETGAHSYSLNFLVVLLYGDSYLIEIRSLSGPLQRVLNVELNGSVDFGHALARLYLHLRGVEHLAAYYVAIRRNEVDDKLGVALCLNVHSQCAVAILCVEVGSDAYVVNMCLLRA